MVPSDFANFFIVTAGAGGALIGLLFVAISLAPERTVRISAPIDARAMSSSAFTALVNGFFISLGAVIPHWNIGGIVLVMSIVAIVNSLSLMWTLLRPWPSWQQALRRILLMVVGLFIYGDELLGALQILSSSNLRPYIFTLSILIISIYGLALFRAWELLGVQRAGLLAWLNPLNEFNKKAAAGGTEQVEAE